MDKEPNDRDGQRLSYFNRDHAFDKSRYRLPHWDQGSVWQFVTWRLADSLPTEWLQRWTEERLAWLAHHPEPWDAITEQEYRARFRASLEAMLDSGHGSCLLSQPDPGRIVEQALQFFDGIRYFLGPYVIMPNHVHVLFCPAPGYPLGQIMHSWKSYTAKQINAILRKSGAVWQPEYWDRAVRNERHWQACRKYIEGNPKNLRTGSFRLGCGNGGVTEDEAGRE